MRILRLESTDSLAELKEQYLLQTTAPLDGMWLFGFVPMAAHYGFHDGEDLIGFCCVNAEGYLLQLFLSASHRHLSPQVMEPLLRPDGPSGELHGAFASTAEPQYLSLCLDHFPTFEVNALMYQRDRPPGASAHEIDGGIPPLVPIEGAQIATAVAFAVENIGAPEDWLAGYYANLISRRELFGVWAEDRLIALGENRRNDGAQVDCADLGVVVAQSERGKGIATEVMRRLAIANDAKGLLSICSTERTNIAAQKAIVRAGFFAHNRILRLRRAAVRV
ncbi:MAG: GNAT family N-acetyltransferase [Deltaproteobacteria bacterium]|nr:GNAT family N-acetyltransferase [Deltaproteobacteria bacterium]